MESELVSGFMTEHAAVVFVFFFLAEYSSIVLMCILSSILFLGGYLSVNIFPVLDDRLFFLLDYLGFFYESNYLQNNLSEYYSFIEGLISGLTLGIKSSMLIFTFIWVRASFPRVRFDQLMSFS